MKLVMKDRSVKLNWCIMENRKPPPEGKRAGFFLFLTAVIFTAGKLFTLAKFVRARCLNDYHDGRNS